jgi:ring-1,2-phenylacetyl-CoA epoxidase subunit PaaD
MVTKEEIYSWLEEVSDPEVPVLSIIDLGVVRNVSFENNAWQITLTPTYSGCPAMQTMEEEILLKLKERGLSTVKILTTLSPAWTTDWLSENGRKKLKAYGIAPPEDEQDKSLLFSSPTIVSCPICNSKNTRLISQFGSTACKAHYQCSACQEPFDYFKCLK